MNAATETIDTRGHLEGFRFAITTTAGETREVRLLGCGGEIGAGCLSAAETLTGDRRDLYIERVLRDALACARHEAEETGEVRAWSPDADLEDRLEIVPVRSVDGVRGVFYRGAS